jgi:hypothetical protein
MKREFKVFILIMAVAFVAGTTLSINAHFTGDEQAEMRFGVLALCSLGIVACSKPLSLMLGAAVTVLTQYSNVLENNTFIGKGITSYTKIYEAVSALVLKAAKEQHVCYAQLTGAMTINATLTNLKQFDKIVFYFDNDATQRVVTFGTGFLSSGTVTIPISKGAIVIGYFDGTAIRIASREIYA